VNGESRQTTDGCNDEERRDRPLPDKSSKVSCRLKGGIRGVAVKRVELPQGFIADTLRLQPRVTRQSPRGIFDPTRDFLGRSSYVTFIHNSS
jgi:hypothetical protein